jgi:hypothetical protein
LVAAAEIQLELERQALVPEGTLGKAMELEAEKAKELERKARELEEKAMAEEDSEQVHLMNHVTCTKTSSHFLDL